MNETFDNQPARRDAVPALHTVETHTAGQPTRIVFGGVPRLIGATVAAKRADLRERLDHLRTFLTSEPRGHSGMYGAFLTEPCDAAADAGCIFFSTAGYDDMCGHGTIGVVTMLIEEGIVQASAPTVSVTLETPAGLVRTAARVEGGRVVSVRLVNVPAFVHTLDFTVDVPGIGTVTGDVAFGGNWYYYVDINSVGMSLDVDHLPELRRAGVAIKAAVDARLELVHPADTNVARSLLGVSFVEQGGSSAAQRNLVVETPDFFDRSPCGTGTCGRLAILRARGELEVGGELRNRGIFGGTFLGTIEADTRVGERVAIVPALEGAAVISGYARWLLSREDPFGAEGFLIGS